MSTRCLAASLTLLCGCSTPSVEVWGNLRDVLREGRTEGRVALDAAVRPGAIGVGLLEGLEGEITIDRGVAHVASVENAQPVWREAGAGDSATMLVLAVVPEWSESVLPALSSIDELETAIAEVAAAKGVDLATPLPVRVEGRFDGLDLHVLNRSCPIANPDGPPPWRLENASAEGVLVGFYARGAAGRLTHHGQRTHLHAIVRAESGEAVSGHLDAVEIGAGARLFLAQ